MLGRNRTHGFRSSGSLLGVAYFPEAGIFFEGQEKKPRTYIRMSLDFRSIFGILASTRESGLSLSAEEPVNQLIAFLLDHAMLDFSGGLTIDMVKDFIRDDDSREARSLLSKLMQDGGVEDMQLTLADCLQEQLRTGLTEAVVREQLKLYAES
jgi:hypothetical protein